MGFTMERPDGPLIADHGPAPGVPTVAVDPPDGLRTAEHGQTSVRAIRRSLASSYLVSVLLFSAFSLTYLATAPSLRHQQWDSMSYGHACEVEGIRQLWGNHPLGHLVLCSVFEVARMFGYAGRALPIHKAVNSLLGGATATVFLLILYKGLRISLTRAAACTVILGASYGYWHFAGTADIYIVAVLLEILAWTAIVRALTSGASGLVGGVLSGLAILAHQLNGALLVVGVASLVSGVTARGRRAVVVGLGSLLLSTSLTVVTGYVLLGYLHLGHLSPTGLVSWIVGYGIDPTYGGRLRIGSVKSAVGAAVHTVIAHGDGLAELARLAVLLATAAAIVFGIAFSRKAMRGAPSILVPSMAQCAVGFVAVLSWLPSTVGKFWLLMLPAGIITLAYAAEGAEVGLRRHVPEREAWHAINVGLCLLAIFVVLFNGTFAILREARRDPVFERSLQLWLQHSRPEDVLLTGTGRGHLTACLRYWEHRTNTLHLYRALQESMDPTDRFGSLRTTINTALADGRAVLVAPVAAEHLSADELRLLALSRDDVRRFFAEYLSEGPVFQYQENGILTPVHRLRVRPPTAGLSDDAGTAVPQSPV
jgi:hypothetical protein